MYSKCDAFSFGSCWGASRVMAVCPAEVHGQNFVFWPFLQRNSRSDPCLKLFQDLTLLTTARRAGGRFARPTAIISGGRPSNGDWQPSARTDGGKGLPPQSEAVGFGGLPPEVVAVGTEEASDAAGGPYPTHQPVLPPPLDSNRVERRLSPHPDPLPRSSSSLHHFRGSLGQIEEAGKLLHFLQSVFAMVFYFWSYFWH